MNRRIIQLVVLCLFLLPFSGAEAVDWQSLKEKVRPLIVKTLGKDKAGEWLGPNPSEVSLPPIPQVNEEATSTDTYQKDKQQKKTNWSDEKEKEYDYGFINELYSSVINEEPNRDDLAKWMNAMGQGATREGVYRGLVLGQTYKGMENYTGKANQRVAKFVSAFSKKFLARDVKPKSFQDTNFYKLKRETTERTLGVLDALAKKGDHLARWYAVFSGELAKNFPSVWENKIRKSDSEKNHYQWAEKVPDQHLKSEVIIKLHKVMNSLQG